MLYPSSFCYTRQDGAKSFTTGSLRGSLVWPRLWLTEQERTANPKGCSTDLGCRCTVCVSVSRECQEGSVRLGVLYSGLPLITHFEEWRLTAFNCGLYLYRVFCISHLLQVSTHLDALQPDNPCPVCGSSSRQTSLDALYWCCWRTELAYSTVLPSFLLHWGYQHQGWTPYISCLFLLYLS